MTDPRLPIFGQRKEPHTIIIARGDAISHFAIRPWVLLVGASVCALAAIGYLLATFYLVIRDDLIGANIAREARVQQLYEDRISALRVQVDRITSRQLLDQRMMEDKVAELIERQKTLSRRDGRLAPLLKRASDVPLPKKPETAPEQHTQLLLLNDDPADAAFMGIDPIITGPVPGRAAPQRTEADTLRPSEGLAGESTAEKAEQIFHTINRSLRQIETAQIHKVRNLTESAFETADNIAGTLNAAGLKIEAQDDKTGMDAGMGGPLIVPESPSESIENFDLQLQDLDTALNRLDRLKKTVRTLPLANPAPEMPVTSLFGMRRDPLLGTPAFHAGIDFRAESGQRVTATATGIVTKAGRNGGYGNMVEIDHGNGFSSRYAHLSRVLVRESQRVPFGAPIGEAGNTGRSTGTHLHYEIHRNGTAVNPASFLKTGRQIEQLL
ncbi:M23 family metallopeptidase [Phyllobacterium leguminum]|uniref:Peptidase M23-like protein n=1 Tax=Phyllobacterium leguminum TaxID=314237 RepID=A0A318T5S3_9HYPH|nr:M23 family metallopeptidase [Phyllobacterium leguminum]PYE88215.1 peptidase M23-like protein [Phyllobacterium leguminum]